MEYIIGSNMPGYMPDNEPYSVEGIDHAKQCLVEDIERYIDEMYQMNDEDNHYDIDKEEETFTEFKNAPAQECNVWVGDYVFWITTE